MNTTFDFKDKVALVTGGVSGIGAAASLAFNRAGASVIACGVTEQEIDAAKANPDFAGIRIEALNVRDDDAVKRLISSLDQLDFVVNSAGIIRRAAEHDPATQRADAAEGEQRKQRLAPVHAAAPIVATILRRSI